jgi:hypothetical protein
MLQSRPGHWTSLLATPTRLGVMGGFDGILRAKGEAFHRVVPPIASPELDVVDRGSRRNKGVS